jgi:ABC-type glutathione transport system ATPase component
MLYSNCTHILHTVLTVLKLYSYTTTLHSYCTHTLHCTHTLQATGAVAVEVNNVCRSFNGISGEGGWLVEDTPGTLALDRVSFKVRRGHCVGLLGPNGAGKVCGNRSGSISSIQ